MFRPRPPLPASSGANQGVVLALLENITEIVRYNVQKSRYECALALQEQMRKLRETNFQAEAKTCLALTTMLAKCKAKMKCLETIIATYPSDIRDVWSPLVNELQAKINDLRIKRKAMQ